eukprot:scaffold536_cov137-Skeletonema_marinoi.AAC.6
MVRAVVDGNVGAANGEMRRRRFESPRAWLGGYSMSNGRSRGCCGMWWGTSVWTGEDESDRGRRCHGWCRICNQELKLGGTGVGHGKVEVVEAVFGAAAGHEDEWIGCVRS